MRRAPQVTLVSLEGLDRPELATLVDGILGHSSQWTLVEAVWGRSQGNPFFAEELVAAREVHDLPPELQSVILGRVAELSEPAQRVLRLAAVVGSSVDHDLLAAMADDGDGSPDDRPGHDGLGPRALEQAIEELVDGQVLVVEPSRTGYRFRHALTREAVEGAILPGERRRLHRRAAMTLAARGPACQPGGAGAAELAAHWWAAEAWAEALEASVSAADAAAEVWAYPEVLAHLDRADAAFDQIARADPSAAERALAADRPDPPGPHRPGVRRRLSGRRQHPVGRAGPTAGGAVHRRGRDRRAGSGVRDPGPQRLVRGRCRGRLPGVSAGSRSWCRSNRRPRCGLASWPRRDAGSCCSRASRRRPTAAARPSRRPAPWGRVPRRATPCAPWAAVAGCSASTTRHERASARPWPSPRSSRTLTI